MVDSFKLKMQSDKSLNLRNIKPIFITFPHVMVRYIIYLRLQLGVARKAYSKGNKIIKEPSAITQADQKWR